VVAQTRALAEKTEPSSSKFAMRIGVVTDIDSCAAGGLRDTIPISEPIVIHAQGGKAEMSRAALQDGAVEIEDVFISAAIPRETLEPRAFIADYNPADQLTVHHATQSVSVPGSLCR